MVTDRFTQDARNLEDITRSGRNILDDLRRAVFNGVDKSAADRDRESNNTDLQYLKLQQLELEAEIRAREAELNEQEKRSGRSGSSKGEERGSSSRREPVGVNHGRPIQRYSALASRQERRQEGRQETRGSGNEEECLDQIYDMEGVNVDGKLDARELMNGLNKMGEQRGRELIAHLEGLSETIVGRPIDLINENTDEINLHVAAELINVIGTRNGLDMTGLEVGDQRWYDWLHDATGQAVAQLGVDVDVSTPRPTPEQQTTVSQERVPGQLKPSESDVIIGQSSERNMWRTVRDLQTADKHGRQEYIQDKMEFIEEYNSSRFAQEYGRIDVTKKADGTIDLTFHVDPIAQQNRLADEFSILTGAKTQEQIDQEKSAANARNKVEQPTNEATDETTPLSQQDLEKAKQVEAKLQAIKDNNPLYADVAEAKIKGWLEKGGHTIEGDSALDELALYTAEYDKAFADTIINTQDTGKLLKELLNKLGTDPAPKRTEAEPQVPQAQQTSEPQAQTLQQPTANLIASETLQPLTDLFYQDNPDLAASLSNGSIALSFDNSVTVPSTISGERNQENSPTR